MKGKCYYCSKELTERTVKRHMKNCIEMKKAIQDEFETEKKKRKQFMISLKDKYDTSTYCIYVSIDASLQLYHIDKFIRDVWVECCGHLSMFKIGQKKYFDNSDGNYAMNVKLKDILHTGQKFEYEYDFGSTTYLNLEVVDEIEVSRNHSQIEIIARNNEEGVPNSPRDGICGYICNEHAEDQYFPGNNNTYTIDKHKPKDNDIFSSFPGFDTNINEDFLQSSQADKFFEELLRSYESNMQDTLNDIEEETDDIFNKGIYSFNLTEILNSYTKHQLSDLAKNMNIEISSSLKKKDYIEKLVDEYEESVIFMIEKFDEDKYKLLQEGMRNQGIIEFDEKKLFIQLHLLNDGLMFPCNFNGSHVYVIPEIVQNIINKNNTIEFRKKIKNNTEIIKIVSGMLYAYGVMSCADVMKLLRKYGYDFSNANEIISIIEENTLQNSIPDYAVNDSYGEPMVFVNKYIEDYIEVLRLIDDSYKYKFFDKEELLLMGNIYYLEESSIGKRFIKDLLNLFCMTRDQALENVNMMSLDIQYRSFEEILNDVIDGIDIIISNNDNKIVKNVINKFLKNIPLWKYRGRTINEIEAYKISNAQEGKIERNESCPCGSSRKYTDCCGKVINLFSKR